MPKLISTKGIVAIFKFTSERSHERRCVIARIVELGVRTGRKVRECIRAKNALRFTALRTQMVVFIPQRIDKGAPV